jgi:hypothetical protein
MSRCTRPTFAKSLNALRFVLALTSLPLLLSCESTDATADRSIGGFEVVEGALQAKDWNPLNLNAGAMVLYEVQVRSANACDPAVGSAAQKAACTAKLAPKVTYQAEGMTCKDLTNLQKIKLGTLDDMLADTADYRQGITLRYIQEKVGANAVWLMPVFPNNAKWSIPDACDNLGSPYAVRDYYHVQGKLAQTCIKGGKDEDSATPCWGNTTLDTFIAQAHKRGLKVMLDLAFNHFGHNYLMYDTTEFTPIRERIAKGEDLEKLWNFTATYDAGLLKPTLLDTTAKLTTATGKAGSLHQKNLAALKAKCPKLSGDNLVRAYNVWRVALDSERAKFPCTSSYLEFAAPGFYVGADHWNPSVGAGDNFSGDGFNTWKDVKFLYHHEANIAHKHEFYRNREYLFRVMNYWTSRGVDAFRLDHTTDAFSGIDPNEWDYIVSKVNYYAMKRGQATPVYMAEEFHDQPGMNKVVDMMTEGYVTDMCGRNGVTKNAAHVEKVLNGMKRFGDHAFVMTALETHDEKRLLDGTGFDVWTGAGFWGIGAASRSTPMLLMGQEFGEPWQLGFRKSDYLRSRFEGTANYNSQGDVLREYYRKLITGRLAPQNQALLASGQAYLRTKAKNAIDQRLLAMVKWSPDGNVVFVVHNLWNENAAQTYYLPPDLKKRISMQDGLKYKLVDVLSGQQQGACKTGADLGWEFYVSLPSYVRAQWLRLELCS